MLTVLTTSMGAGTYAKFVSRVSASGGSKSAGFLITSTNSTSDVDLTASTLIAPSQTKNIDITFSYYSQVLTQFKSNTNDVTVVGTGALEGNFFALIDEYNSTWLPLHKDSYSDNNKKAPSSLGEMFSLSFSGGSSIAEACALAVGKASNGSLAVNGSVVEAMPNNATQSLSCSISATLKWEEISDAWDTFIGNKIYTHYEDVGESTGIKVHIGVTAEQCFSVLVDGTTNIPNGYFQGRKDIKEVVIPDGVTSIGANSFDGCTNLEKVEIPEGVTTIGNGAFQNCTSLKEIIIPSSVKTINDNTFQGCTNLESVNIPEGVTTIGTNAFNGCSSLTEIEIPSTVTMLGGTAFQNNTSLKKVTLSSDAITFIGAYPFNGSTSIEYNQDGNGCYLGNESNPYIMLVKPVSTTIIEIEINSNCKLLSGMALDNCRQLTNLIVPEGVITIGDFAFRDCINLQEISLPSTLENMSARIFQSNNNLKNIYFNNGNSKYGSSGSCIYEKATKTLIVAAGINPIIPDDGSVEIIAANSIYTQCETITIPKTIKEIKEGAFLVYFRLQEIVVDPENSNYFVSGNCLIERSSGTVIVGVDNFTIPNNGSVKRIGLYAFYSNSLVESVVIPEGVTEIKQQSFSYMAKLKEVTISKTVKVIANNAFTCCSNLTTIRFTGTPEEWAAKSYSSQEQFKGKNIIFNA